MQISQTSISIHDTGCSLPCRPSTIAYLVLRSGSNWNGSGIGMEIKERIHTLQKPRFDFCWRAVHDVQCHASF